MPDWMRDWSIGESSPLWFGLSHVINGFKWTLLCVIQCVVHILVYYEWHQIDDDDNILSDTATNNNDDYNSDIICEIMYPTAHPVCFCFWPICFECARLGMSYAYNIVFVRAAHHVYVNHTENMDKILMSHMTMKLDTEMKSQART